jgi:HD-like signal output (HDOD) protein
MPRFNLHSVGTAMFSDLLSQHVATLDAESAFAAGLFHDLGRLLIALSLPDEHAQLNIVCSGGRLSRCECEKEILGFDHSELSSEALARWNMPESILCAVREHHNLEQPMQPQTAVELSRVVGVANVYVNALGHSIDADSKYQDRHAQIEHATALLHELGVKSSASGLREAFESEFEGIRTLL